MTLGDPRIHVDSCASTQELLESTMPEGAVAVADFQTSGRGRLDHSWEAPPGEALLASVLLKPPPTRPLPQLALVAGVAVADALERLTGLSVQVKWPNDVMLRRSKVAGILAEVRDGAVVLGIGINLNQARNRLPERAGSLRTETGQVWDRDEVLDAVLEDLGSRYDLWRDGGLDAIYEGLGARDFLRGRHVAVDGTTGIAELIDREGRLRIGVGHGHTVTVESGEVTYER